MLVDLYLLTMAQAYWRSGRNSQATFSLHYRTLPPQRGYMVFMGLEDALDDLERFSFGQAELEHIEARGDFEPEFVRYLSDLKFTGSVRAMPEGTPCFPGEPLMEVTAPVIEAQVVETCLINHVCLQTTLATKARRVVSAARGAAVIDFGARRAHGADAAAKMARAGYAAGFSATSNVEAAQRYSIPAAGTMAHSFVTAFEAETDAFRAYQGAFPDSSTLLVDTYETIGGVAAAVAVAREARARGGDVAAIRLDSGDLADLSRRARDMLDAAGLDGVRIVASGGLDEHSVEALADGGAPIDAYGVGTAVCTSADAPYTDCVYKMVEYDGRPVGKLSPGKSDPPSRKQVYRLTEDGCHSTDRVQALGEPPPGGAGWDPLLGRAMTAGRREFPPPSLAQIRSRLATEVDRLPAEVTRLREPRTYPVGMSDRLGDLTASMGPGVNA